MLHPIVQASCDGFAVTPVLMAKGVSLNGRERVAIHLSSIVRSRRHLQVIESAPKNMRRDQAVVIF